MNVYAIRFAAALVTTCAAMGFAQTQGTPPQNSEFVQIVKQLQDQISALQRSVDELRSESEHYRAETRELERRLESVNQSTAEAPQPTSSPIGNLPEAGSTVSSRVSKLEEEYELLTGKVDDQYQTKVESGSKYRVRLSGLVMLNLFGTRGSVDSIDSPQFALPAGSQYGNGSFTGTLRQSQVGLEVFGPQWDGAKISGDLRFDFAGGFPRTENGAVLGLMRLRTGNVRFDWRHTSVIAGQDAPMFSPLSPTSVIALAEPEFSYSGNLWTWVPQVQAQHWFELGSSQRLSFAAGFLDPLTGEPPVSGYYRTAQAGEASRQPGYSARIGWSNLKDEDRPSSVSLGGYFSRQNWGFGRYVDGWAGTADWQLALPKRITLKGELYRGNALGGFGAASGESVIAPGILTSPGIPVRALKTIGGWAQAAYQLSPVLQFNIAGGIDNPFSRQLRQVAAAAYALYPEVGIHRTAMANVIYRPRSDLLFSMEYRHLISSRLTGQNASAENVGMGIGLLF